jgi:hypothetical protein
MFWFDDRDASAVSTIQPCPDAKAAFSCASFQNIFRSYFDTSYQVLGAPPPNPRRRRLGPLSRPPLLLRPGVNYSHYSYRLLKASGSLEALHSPQPVLTLSLLETVSLPRQREWLRRYLGHQVPPFCCVTDFVTVRSFLRHTPRNITHTTRQTYPLDGSSESIDCSEESRLVGRG